MWYLLWCSIALFLIHLLCSMLNILSIFLSEYSEVFYLSETDFLNSSKVPTHTQRSIQEICTGTFQEILAPLQISLWSLPTQAILWFCDEEEAGRVNSWCISSAGILSYVKVNLKCRKSFVFLYCGWYVWACKKTQSSKIVVCTCSPRQDLVVLGTICEDACNRNRQGKRKRKSSCFMAGWDWKLSAHRVRDLPGVTQAVCVRARPEPSPSSEVQLSVISKWACMCMWGQSDVKISQCEMTCWGCTCFSWEAAAGLGWPKQWFLSKKDSQTVLVNKKQ